MKTEKEIKEAVERLKLNKEKSIKFNFFGEDNHEKINVMIDVIENQRNEDFIYNNYPSCDEFGDEDMEAHGKWRAAMNALEFLAGDCILEDILYHEIN